MKTSVFLFLPLFYLNSVAFGEDGKQPVPTLTEASAQVESEMSLKRSREHQERLDLLAVPAETETVRILKNGGSIRLRQVAAPPQSAAPRDKKAAIRPPRTEEEMQKFLAEAKSPENMPLSVTVYDDQISSIRLWHEGETYEVLSNVPFSHLQVLGSFETEEAVWSVIAMVEEVQEGQEQRIAGQARRFGATYTPRKRPDTSHFTSLEDPEYLVFPEHGETIPEDVFAKLDALHAYYLTNESKLAVEHERREVFAEAHRRYRAENPPAPQDIVINFWRVE
ncbi:hypothetical protein [Puniceicoccus vermicola]|uniref:Uncharacterized protein n=1 Tax=Puniceicoccus vermicola TaxID=388746 RepID=A0A7X1B1W3_9BACT|nr:hypothetical protein [Puniceicoccus vermicola]MBC2604094.1 hypothetical protein [Puniceicoccus vermicola]